MNGKIIAVDFDGTVVKHEYPEIGKDVPHAVKVLKRLNEAGVRIIVWTMRCGEHLEKDAANWFEQRGIEVWAYNENPEQSSWTESRKCYAHAYIDDAAIGCPLIYPEEGRPYVDWKKVEVLLEEQFYL
jgi:hydroxymethylpyrimidine pyrophosphatase-like HAD family hydrolase